MRAADFSFSIFAWVMITAFALPSVKFSLADSQVADHSHEEQHHASIYEYNSHDDVEVEEGSHTHEHRHGPEEPLHSHEHKHSTQHVNASDAKIAYTLSVYRLTPISTQVKFSFTDRKLCCQGYLKGIFRPPIA